MDHSPIAAWTFVSECPVPPDVAPVLLQGEQTWAAYETVRDRAVFTDRRIIVRDAPGLSGKKAGVWSLPYSAITLWSSQTVGRMLDINAELQLWTAAGHVKVRLTKDVDLRRLDQLLARAVLGG